jgi:hypothetical protein
VFVRYQSPVPDRRGRRIGVFGLVNMLGYRGYLTAEQEQFRRTTNAWYDAAYANPSSVDPAVYEANPQVAAWFKSSAEHLMAPIPGYLAILAAHNVPCDRYESPAPGRVLYEDPHQVVVVPHEAEDPAHLTTMLWLRPRAV